MIALAAGDVERVHEASLTLLERVGVLFDDEEVHKRIVAVGGEETTTARVARLSRQVVADAVAQAPRVVRLASVSGEVVELGADGPTVFWSGNALHIAEGKTRRPMRSDDLARLVRVLEALPRLHAPVATSIDDHPALTRDFVGFRILAQNSRKHLRPCVYTPRGPNAIYEMAQVIGPGDFREYPIFSLGYTAVSPLRWSSSGCAVFRESSGRGIPIMVNAEPMAGAGAPVTLAGAIAQANAEALAGVVMSQALEPGRPVVFNLGFAHPFDMRAAISLTGCAECGLLAAAGAQLARHHDLPSASWMSTEAAVPDAQAAIEKMATGVLHGLAGVNIIWGFGQLDSQQTMSMEMAVIDHEMAGQIMAASQGVEVSEETLALDLIEAAGVGGSFIGTEHTYRHYREALVYPDLLFRGERSRWEGAGSKDLAEMAREKVRDILAEEQEPLLSEEQEAELATIEARWREIVER